MRRLLLLCLGLMHGIGHAEVAVIPLQHRPAAQVISALTPHLGETDRISSIDNKLIINTSPGNLIRLKEILSAIDVPPRQLLITLRRSQDDVGRSQGAGVTGQIGTAPADTRLQGRIWSTRELRDTSDAFQVRVLEGAAAFIQSGQSVPIRLKQIVLGPHGQIVSESMVYRDLQSGFEATPTLAGNTVTVEIRPRHEAPLGDPRGVVQTHTLSTTVSGRLGEWIPLGGDTAGTSDEERGYVTYSTRTLRQQGQLLLKVEEISDPDGNAQRD